MTAIQRGPRWLRIVFPGEPQERLRRRWTTPGGQNQATTGMRMMGMRLDQLDGQPVEGVFAILHTVLFWGLNVVLTPLILIASLFLDRERTVHDLLLGTDVTRADR